jgi:mono/diheme cytochrome c family protein
MRVRFPRVWCAALVLLAAGWNGANVLAAQAGSRSDAAKLKNPVRSTSTSIAAGKKLYDAQCASCHGTTGKGDGRGGAMLKPPPSDLTDSEWKHGDSDGAIVVVLRDGIEQTSMRGYGGRIPETELWNIVNYVRTLAPKSSKSQ